MEEQKVNDKFKVSQVIAAIQRADGIVAGAARILGCNRDTIDNYIKRYPTVAQAYKEVNETTLDIAEGILVKQWRDDGDKEQLRYYLNAKGKRRGYGVTRSETITDPVDWAKVDDDTLAQYRAGKISEADVRRSYAGQD